MYDRIFRTLLPNTDRRPQSAKRSEELRVICGTRGIPGTVAPFRAWRGSRDLVAQSPKFHAPAFALRIVLCSGGFIPPRFPRVRVEKYSILSWWKNVELQGKGGLRDG